MSEITRWAVLATAGAMAVVQSPYEPVDWMLNNMESSKDKRYNKFKSNIQGALRKNIELLDLKPLVMVFFPIMEYNHYYLVIFELRNPRIFVSDNFDDSVPLVGLRNHEDYFQKDSPYKLKDLFVKYLKECNHPKTDEIAFAVIKKVKISWSTMSNVVDCAVFVMRHGKVHGDPRTVQHRIKQPWNEEKGTAKQS
ncbi:hypothetical protein E3N88_35700 [Mikania micrantha]|uniref:Ubiquitin-like protease family profile domain-containing protein n=1 Tax=Mikania micrantha TaxID=192012 RepID=A0A5N6M1M6_9ASTR|nr:hypothetical protein E3N88_35700 [Mikania micrantha]